MLWVRTSPITEEEQHYPFIPRVRFSSLPPSPFFLFLEHPLKDVMTFPEEPLQTWANLIFFRMRGGGEGGKGMGGTPPPFAQWLLWAKGGRKCVNLELSLFGTQKKFQGCPR